MLLDMGYIGEHQSLPSVTPPTKTTPTPITDGVKSSGGVASGTPPHEVKMAATGGGGEGSMSGGSKNGSDQDFVFVNHGDEAAGQGT